jgi:enterochelin esterase family protein
MKLLVAALILAIPAFAAEKLTAPEIFERAKKLADQSFLDALRDTLGADNIKKGTAFIGEGPDGLWAVEAPEQPELYIDDRLAGAMHPIGRTGVYYYKGSMTTGRSHAFYYKIENRQFGGRNDIPCYGPDSYQQPGVPQGTLSPKMTHTSKIFEGMVSDWWIYVPAQYDAAKPAALMVWHDGQGMIGRNGPSALNVFDNLTAQGRIPVMIQVFIAPGKVGEKAMRGIEYDTVSDRYPRFLRDEILPEVFAKYNVRRDGYSHAIAGNSSGGISSFNAAWWMNELFPRVLMRIASFANLQQNHPGQFDGGNTFPYRVRREEKHNIRVWSQDGSEDLENPFGSWPANNINMINSLKFREYDFHFSWGNGSHNGAHGNSELPEEMTWLWRGYDPAKTEQVFTMDPAEKDKPFYRVRELNRQ